MKLSLIMPVKNGEKFLRDSIGAVLKFKKIDYELIIINDASTDDTKKILQEFSDKSERVKFKDNTGKGKVQALNYGYELSSGDYIKCIDADDVLLEEFEDHFLTHIGVDSHFHNAFVTDENLNVTSNYVINPSFLELSYVEVLKNIIGFPRWSWTFKREIADKLFPMPTNLPFEDAWFAIMIKRWSKSLDHLNFNLYLYRQHSNNTFGGITNFKKDIVIFRANRVLKLIECFKENHDRLIDEREYESFWDDLFLFNTLLAKDSVSYSEIVRSTIPNKMKAKIILQRKLSYFAPSVIRLKWYLDNRKNAK